MPSRTCQHRCTQERKEAEAAAQAAKAESIRKTEERLAMRQRQAAEAAAKQETEAQSLVEDMKKTETEAGEKVATASPTAPAPTEERRVKPKGEPSPDAVDTQAAGAPLSTTTRGTDETTTSTGGNGDSQGTNGEQIEDTTTGDVAVATSVGERAGAAGAELSTISEEATERLGEHDVAAASGENKGGHGGDGETNLGVTAKHRSAAGSAENGPSKGGKETLQGASQEVYEGTSVKDDTAAPLDELARLGGSRASAFVLPSASGSGSGEGDSVRTGSTRDSPAREELAKQRKDIAILVGQAKEGMAYIKQSVDVADVLRGFVFTKHGIPVRDTAVGQELLRDGRSSVRERFDHPPLSLSCLSLDRSVERDNI